MTKRLMSHDPFTGITTYFEPDGNGGFHLSYESDVEPLLEQNKIQYTDGTDGYANGKGREFKHVAEIPMSLILKWKIEDGIDVFNKNDWNAVKRKLNSNEWLLLRTSGGHI